MQRQLNYSISTVPRFYFPREGEAKVKVRFYFRREREAAKEKVKNAEPLPLLRVGRVSLLKNGLFESEICGDRRDDETASSKLLETRNPKST